MKHIQTYIKTYKHLYKTYTNIYNTYTNIYKTYKNIYKTCKNLYKTYTNLYNTYKNIYKTLCFAMCLPLFCYVLLRFATNLRCFAMCLGVVWMNLGVINRPDTSGTVAPRFKSMVPPEGSPLKGSYIVSKKRI